MEERRKMDRRRRRVTEVTIAKLLALSITIGVVLATAVLVLVFRVSSATNQLQALARKDNTILLQLRNNRRGTEQQISELSDWIKTHKLR